MNYRKLINKQLEGLSPEVKEKLLQCDLEEITKIYYNVISNDLENNIDLYYNGSLMVDMHSDSSTFIGQDVENIILHANILDGNKLLECGCGGGYFFKRLIRKKPSIEYNGIDLSPIQIKNSKSLNPDYEDSFQCCDWNDLPFEDNSFDNIIFLETIGYATDIDRLLSECYRVLKPGGVLFSKHPGCLSDTFHKPITAAPEIKRLSLNYGYSDSSLGMLMNVPNFVEKLKEYNFNVPKGAIVPTQDHSMYIKSHFIREIHECFEVVRVPNSYITARYPDGDPIKFWEKVYEINPNHTTNSILSGLGKLHPELISFYSRSTFVEKFLDDEDSVYRKTQKLMSPCVIVTAIKK